MTTNTQYTNQLASETSPYLLQHVHNPVDWHPWGPEALDKARRENKPILLSIGYSACHWCHVMAHESFEDPATADVMNALFVNIKVDREERPDLDKIYQTAHSLLTRRNGGWPLTMILDPDTRVPFFGGTYFPPEPRHGLPAFTELCQRVVDFYREKRAELDQQNQSLVEFMRDMQRSEITSPDALNSMPLDVARQQLGSQYDKQHGGFGKAPKFPHPTSLERLLRHWAATGREDQEALDMALFTLDRMALGGMYDQIGGGFCRYSVDEQWMIPHFEKMLYDNGPLLSLYSEAWAATGNPVYTNASWPRQQRGYNAKCKLRKAATIPAWTQIARAKKENSTSGHRMNCMRYSMMMSTPRLPYATASTASPTSRDAGTRTYTNPLKLMPPHRRCCHLHEPNYSKPASNAFAPDSMTRSWYLGTR